VEQALVKIQQFEEGVSSFLPSLTLVLNSQKRRTFLVKFMILDFTLLINFYILNLEWPWRVKSPLAYSKALLSPRVVDVAKKKSKNILVHFKLGT